ncbi:phosphatase PAP2 family protein [Cognatiluteimonas profundi]|uniref:phosphatase PAP2 family protein n=1 Tax=Cognatiluteimonas profundi TaxID=2594501 RepID=UPI00131E719D|nr:phosphatase PAP2 family protein [Lysobacter profundi]
MAPRSALLAAALALSALSPQALAAGGPFGIDHRVNYDNSGIWKRSYQKDLAAGAALTVVGGALFGNSDSRLGHTFDQALDSMVLTAATTSVMKVAFSRERPSETNDPNRFFQGGSHRSFPSGEVAEISAIVTPFIAEYRQDHPAVYALALLPAYDAVARVKVQGHWQSDVLVGAAVGVAWGLYAHHRRTPLIMGLLPGNGLMVGYSRRF